MDINSLKHASAHDKNIRSDSHKAQAKKPDQAEEFNPQHAKQITETMIMGQLLNIDMGSVSKSQQLLLQRVIEKLDAILAPAQGENATQKAVDAGIDFSPKATAQRITSHASNMIARFQHANQLEKGDPKLEDFVNLIQQGIQTGFEDAKGILGGLEVFNDEVETTFESTLAEAMKNMDQIRIQLGLEPLNNKDNDSENTEDA